MMHDIFKNYIDHKIKDFENEEYQEHINDTIDLVSSMVGSILEIIKKESYEYIFSEIKKRSTLNQKMNELAQPMMEKQHFVDNGGVLN